ncbi:MAG: amidase [Anaerolineae bacterium]|nr:MAG: amidase [Anaerolineae bacterium]
MNASDRAATSIPEALHLLQQEPVAYFEQLEANFEERESQVQAFLPDEQRFARVRADYEALDERYTERQDRPPLFGLPIGVKDIFHADGFETHAGSRLPADRLGGQQAASVTRLKQAGALVLGKTVTTEFAYFAPGPTRNPHNLDHTPGGSSSGSAAGVAAGLVPFAFGTQTVGSINRPAAFCGVVGFKPSYGRISTAGVIPLAPSLDHVGFFTAEVGGALAVAPHLLSDWKPGDLDSRLGDLAPGTIRLGIPRGPYMQGASDEALAHFESVKIRLERGGLRVIDVPTMANCAEISERHYLILAAEAAAVHKDWFDEYGELYNPKTAELIEKGREISGDRLTAALEGRGQLREQLQALTEEYRIDAWISPAAPGPAPEGIESTGDPAMNLPWTYSGLPTIGLPSGWSPDQLPLGIQLTGAWYGDERLLAESVAVERALTED